MSEDFDVAIIGGGMVGASLAVALAPLGLAVALVESIPYDAAAQPSFDERTTAVSNGSRRILETIRVWPAVAGASTAIRKIHVSDQGRFGFARIDAAEQGQGAMGFVLPNRVLGAALWERIRGSSAIRVFCPAEVGRIDASCDGSRVGVEVRVAHDAAARSIRTRLVVAADGVHSSVRSAFRVEASSRDYGQTAVITTILPQRFHDHVAYERFTDSGPLALLPLGDGRCTLVLTLNHALVETALGWTDAEFLAEVQRRFGFRLGRFLKVGRRSAYPLSLTHATRTSAGRCVIVGNAAQGLHPVAGMGFNLGLRDVACLAETIAGSMTESMADPGEARVLAAYDAWRARDRRAVIGFTDGLVRVFSHPGSLVRGMRNLGLLAFDMLPPAKAALSRLSTGADGRIPKLARGVALTPGDSFIRGSEGRSP
jgi:2-octaprenyl-6-methoxyphenol hydroxylase